MAVTYIDHRYVSFDERERRAYIAGDAALANLFDQAADYENQVEAQDELIDEEKEKSFAEGKIEGLGIDSAEKIEDLERELNRSEDKMTRMLNVQRKMVDMFSDDRMKTIAGRKEIYKIVKNSLIY